MYVYVSQHAAESSQTRAAGLYVTKKKRENNIIRDDVAMMEDTVFALL